MFTIRKTSVKILKMARMLLNYCQGDDYLKFAIKYGLVLNCTLPINTERRNISYKMRESKRYKHLN